MADATFRHGAPVMIDYTPATGNVAAGDVILLGNLTGLTCVVAHLPITNESLGAVAGGGGVYEVTNLNNAANGAKVYWEGGEVKKVTTVSENMSLFGFVVSNGGGGDNSKCLALHKPYV